MIAIIIDIFLIPLYLLTFFNEGPADEVILQKLNDYSWAYPQEKVYIHTNKSFFVPDEDVWFKAYLMMGPYQVPDTMSGVLYVELISRDEKLIDRKILHMREGLGWGDFHLPMSIDPGKYIIKAYTRYMQNFDPAFYFRKWITVIDEFQGETSGTGSMPDNLQNTKEIPDTAADFRPIHLQFFPEGGNMVEGLQNYIAFKATDSRGRGKHINGVIKNAQGEEITKFESKKLGMGVFPFKPEPDNEYIAMIDYEGEEYQYPLPPPLKEGYVMHINRKEDNVYVWVRNNMGINMDNSFIIGQFRGFPFINIRAEPGKNFLYSIFNVREIPTGIIQLTFFDSLGVPQCERLIFTENKGYQINLDIESDKRTYRKREKVEITVHSEDNSGSYPLTNLSLSIVNKDIVKKKDNDSHIRSYFDLESDLKGFIEHPGYYFNQENEDRYEMLDILMMTHGWRRFVWKEVLEGQRPVMVYPKESAFNITGTVVDFYHRSRPQPGKVRLFIYEDQFYYNEIDTDENGRFAFLGIDIYDSTNVVMQAWEPDEEGERRRKKSVEIRNKLGVRLIDMPYAAINPEYWTDLETEDQQDYNDFYDLNDLILRIDSSYGERTIILDELTVKDTRINSEDSFDRPGKLYKEPTRRIIMDSIPIADESLLLFDLIRKYYPGIQISGMPPDVQVSIRGQRTLMGSNQAMFLLDGVPITSDFLYYFPVSEVAFIDILSQTKAAIYGRDAMNGAIAIYSRFGSSRRTEEGRDWVLNFVHPGYYRAREFYVPDYGVPEEAHIKPDYRRTLYWNPSLTTDDLGNIDFSFYTSDEVADYRVEIEGMTYNGIPVIKEYYFSVE